MILKTFIVSSTIFVAIFLIGLKMLELNLNISVVKLLEIFIYCIFERIFLKVVVLYLIHLGMALLPHFLFLTYVFLLHPINCCTKPKQFIIDFVTFNFSISNSLKKDL